MSPNLVLGMAGASGTAYALRLAQILIRTDVHLHLVVSEAARMVAQREAGVNLPPDSASEDQWTRFFDTELLEGQMSSWGFQPISGDITGRVRSYSLRDYSAGIASGSFLTRGMVICPCSMGTMSSIANGMSSNLIQRAADVHLKERRPMIIVPRETPLSTIALENMANLSRVGATVLPAMPGFYHEPASVSDLVDFIVARICDQLSVPHSLMNRWGE